MNFDQHSDWVDQHSDRVPTLGSGDQLSDHRPRRGTAHPLETQGGAAWSRGLATARGRGDGRAAQRQ